MTRDQAATWRAQSAICIKLPSLCVNARRDPPGCSIPQCSSLRLNDRSIQKVPRRVMDDTISVNEYISSLSQHIHIYLYIDCESAFRRRLACFGTFCVRVHTTHSNGFIWDFFALVWFLPKRWTIVTCDRVKQNSSCCSKKQTQQF